MLAADFRIDELVYAGYTEAELTAAGVGADAYTAALSVQSLFDEEKQLDNDAEGVDDANDATVGASSGDEGDGAGSKALGLAVIVPIAVVSLLLVILLVYCFFCRDSKDPEGGLKTDDGNESNMVLSSVFETKSQFVNPVYDGSGKFERLQV